MASLDVGFEGDEMKGQICWGFFLVFFLVFFWFFLLIPQTYTGTSYGRPFFSYPCGHLNKNELTQSFWCEAETGNIPDHFMPPYQKAGKGFSMHIKQKIANKKMCNLLQTQFG